MTEPILAKAAAARARSAAARRLHHAILRHFTGTGTAPTARHLSGLAPAGVLDELQTADLVLLDQAGELRAAYPFSPTPTDHHVHLGPGRTVHAMCAIDALGMSAMLDRPVTITSREPGTTHPITIHVDHDRAIWHPGTTVVYLATSEACVPSADATCQHINFFTAPESAHAWARHHPHLTGALYSQRDALTTAIAEFGTFLR
jgi:hypothetical protein